MNKTTLTNHPIISNSNQYFYEKKYLSIHSEDRDYIKYPDSSEFEILLPQDYLNVVSVKLVSWAFPSNYNVFSTLGAYNIKMSFKFTELYNPAVHNVNDELLFGIYDALQSNLNNYYEITIEPGFYNPDQMATELTNKCNEAVTIKIKEFFDLNANTYANARNAFSSYDRFKIVYHTVSMKMWFGNTTDRFTLTNENSVIINALSTEQKLRQKKTFQEFDYWGLPSYLGFTRCDAPSYSVDEFKSVSGSVDSGIPRFYYGDAVFGSGDEGKWLLPGAPGANVYFLTAPYKVSFMGPDHIYMEIDGMNCIDEIAPWNVSENSVHSNKVNGIVRSAFAKIPIASTPLTQFFDKDAISYKYWNPPAERISKLKIKFRYHNGQLVSFGQFNYTFMLEFNVLCPQQERSYSVKNAYDVMQHTTHNY